LRGLNGLSGFSGLSRSDDGSLLVGLDEGVEKLLADRAADVGDEGFSAGFRRARFFRKSNMQDSSPAVHRQAS
jgi:hypothetical protein